MANTSEQLMAFGKSLMDMDITKWGDELLGMLAKTNVPGVDMDALVSSRRDDLEALVAANREAVSGMQSIMKQQKKIMTEFLGTLQNTLKTTAGSATQVGSPQDMVVRQTQATKETFNTAVRNMEELAEIINEVSMRIHRPITERVPDALDDVKDVLKVE